MFIRHRRTNAIVCIAAGLLALAAQPVTTQAATDSSGSIHHVSSEVCANCHQDVYKQWKQSMHAQSTALDDPIHATFL